VFDLASPCTCWRKDTITRSCASNTFATWSAKSFFFFPCCHIKLFELSVEVAFNNGSAVAHNKVDLLKFPHRSSCSERTDDTLCCSFASASFTSRNPSFLSADRSNSKRYTILRALFIATPSGRLSQKWSLQGKLFELVLSPLFFVPCSLDLPCCRFLRSCFSCHSVIMLLSSSSVINLSLHLAVAQHACCHKGVYRWSGL